MVEKGRCKHLARITLVIATFLSQFVDVHGMHNSVIIYLYNITNAHTHYMYIIYYTAGINGM